MANDFYAARDRANAVYESPLFPKHAKLAASLLSTTDESATSIIKAMEAAEADHELARSKAAAAPAPTPQRETLNAEPWMTAEQYDALVAAGRDSGLRLQGQRVELMSLPEGFKDDRMQMQGAMVAKALLSKLGVLPSGGMGGGREAA